MFDKLMSNEKSPKKPDDALQLKVSEIILQPSISNNDMHLSFGQQQRPNLA